jgi:HKD family nuclease
MTTTTKIIFAFLSLWAVIASIAYFYKNSYTFRDDSEINFHYNSTSTSYSAIMSGKEYAEQMMK